MLASGNFSHAVTTFLHEMIRSSLHRPVITFLHPLRRVLLQDELAVHLILYSKRQIRTCSEIFRVFL